MISSLLSLLLLLPLVLSHGLSRSTRSLSSTEWVVSVSYGDSPACQGVLVAPYWILTAVTCFPDTLTDGSRALHTVKNGAETFSGLATLRVNELKGFLLLRFDESADFDWEKATVLSLDTWDLPYNYGDNVTLVNQHGGVDDQHSVDDPDYCSRLPHFVNAENAMCVRVPIGGDCEKGAIGTSLVLSTEIGLYLVALSLGESTCSFSLYSRTSPALDWIQKTIAANGIQAGPLSFLTLASLALVVFLAL